MTATGFGKGAAAPWRTGACLLLSSLLSPSLAMAQEESWSIEVGSERALVSMGEARFLWGVDHLRFAHRRPGRGEAFLQFELQRRDRLTDGVLVFGAHRRLGPWTLAGEAGITSAPDFYYRHREELEVARQVSTNLVAHLGYRHLRFHSESVHLLSPAVTLYFSRGEIHGRAFLGRSPKRESHSNALQFTVRSRPTPSVELFGGVALGRGIFDVTSLAGAAPGGWVAFFNPSLRLSTRNLLGVVVSAAHEDPAFERRSLGVYYRRAF